MINPRYAVHEFEGEERLHVAEAVCFKNINLGLSVNSVFPNLPEASKDMREHNQNEAKNQEQQADNARRERSQHPIDCHEVTREN